MASTAPDYSAEGTAKVEGLRYAARQPILDSHGVLHGYELLFREGPINSFSGDGNAATRAMLDNTLFFGLDRLSGGLPVFVNCTEEALRERMVLVLPPTHTVLELLETIDPTDALLAICHELKGLGYRFALDDFVLSAAWKPFIALADYIKVDLSITTPQQRAALVAYLRSCKPVPKVQLVAERVETEVELAIAMQEGFKLFQGYFFCRPIIFHNRTIPANQLVRLKILQEVTRTPLDTHLISNLVKRDASLTYRLLRVVNSPIYGLRKEIRSIHAALILAGDEMFRRVLTLAITAELVGNRPTEILRMSFLRGRFCELAAPELGRDPTEQYLLGILSLMPAMLQVPMEQIVHSMPLRGPVQAALLGESNTERTLLEWLMSYEIGDWESCDRVAAKAGLPAAMLLDLYGTAVLWAETNLSLPAFSKKS